MLQCGLGRKGFILLCFAASGAVMASGSSSLQALMERLHSDMMAPTVTYCSEQVPVIKDEMQLAYTEFLARNTRASQQVFTNLDEVAAISVSEKDWAIPQQLGKTVLEGIRQHDPEVACRGFLHNMQNTSQESLQEKIGAAYQSYKAQMKP